MIICNRSLHTRMSKVSVKREKIRTPTSMIEMIHNLIVEQNRQLLMIIAKKEDLDFGELANAYIRPHHVFKTELETLASASKKPEPEPVETKAKRKMKKTSIT
jgi:hypothetical protein